MRLPLWCVPILAVFFLLGSLVALAAPKAPVTLTLEPTKRIYSSREGVAVKLTFHANQRVKLCLARDILTQTRLEVFRAGRHLTLQPLVVNDNSELFAERRRVQWLNSGESLTLRANIRRFQFADGDNWEPGDYGVSATFGLCEQTPDNYDDPAGAEIPIRTNGLGWFMIMS